MSGNVPLTLWNHPHWELAGVRDPELVFDALSLLQGLASTVFVEGTAPSGDVVDAFQRLQQSGPYLPQDQTLWPKALQWRLPFTREVLSALGALGSSNAPPELLDHLFVYAGDAPLLEWPDAFADDSPIYIADAVPSETIRTLARRLGTSYERLEPGGPTRR
jgi:hypothetical protein